MNAEPDYLGRVVDPACKPISGPSPGMARRPRKGAVSLACQFWRHDATPQLSHAAQAAWCYLWSLAIANDRRECWPSKRTIAERLGCSRRRVQMAMSELVAAGYLRLIRRGSNLGERRANRWRLTLPKGDGNRTGKGRTGCATEQELGAHRLREMGAPAAPYVG